MSGSPFECNQGPTCFVQRGEGQEDAAAEAEAGRDDWFDTLDVDMAHRGREQKGLVLRDEGSAVIAAVMEASVRHCEDATQRPCLT